MPAKALAANAKQNRNQNMVLATIAQKRKRGGSDPPNPGGGAAAAAPAKKAQKVAEPPLGFAICTHVAPHTIGETTVDLSYGLRMDLQTPPLVMR